MRYKLKFTAPIIYVRYSLRDQTRCVKHTIEAHFGRSPVLWIASCLDPKGHLTVSYMIARLQRLVLITASYVFTGTNPLRQTVYQWFVRSLYTFPSSLDILCRNKPDTGAPSASAILHCSTFRVPWSSFFLSGYFFSLVFYWVGLSCDHGWIPGGSVKCGNQSINQSIDQSINPQSIRCRPSERL